MLDYLNHRHLLDSLPVAIALCREADGVFFDANRQWLDLTGLSLAQTVHRSVVELGFWDSAARFRAAFAASGAGGSVALPEIRYVRRDGHRLALQFSASRMAIRGESCLLIYAKDVSEERAAQAALLASEQLLTASNHRLSQQLRLFEAMESLASVGYWTTDDAAPCDSEQEEVWSKGLYGLTGVPEGTAVQASSAKQHVVPEDLARYEEARSALNGNMLEFRWKRPDGTVRWQRARMQRLETGSAQALALGVVRDITREKNTAHALEERLGFIQKVTRRLPGMVFQLRSSQTKGLEFLYVSEPASQIYPGFTAQDLLQDASAVGVLHHPQDVQGITDSLRRAMLGLLPWQHEYRLQLPNGDIRWLYGQGVPEPESGGAALLTGFITDVTARKVAEERLRQSEARFRALTDLSSDWYWEQDHEFRFVHISGNQETAKTLPSQQFVGLTRWETGVEGVSAEKWAAHKAALHAHEVFHDFEMQRLQADGTRIWMSISGAPMFDAQGEFLGYRGIGRDITERKVAEEKIENLAFYDALTGLPNRRLLIERLQLALLGTARHDRYSALLFIDLDNFKDLNDTMGHDMGDLLLKQVAARLKASVREVDTVARLGGDEFVVVLEEIGNEADLVTARVQQIGNKILANLNQAYKLGKLEHHITPSVGVALLSRKVRSVEELLKQADLAMYESKSAGRNTMRFFDPAMQALVALRTTLDHELRAALKHQQFVLFYQPVVDRQATAVGVEALVRWQHPKRGLVSPVEFIGVAEQTGLILPLGQWVLRCACEQLVAWSTDPATAKLTMAVNVSARQFRHVDFVAQVHEVLQSTGVDPTLLKLEITESLLVTDMRQAIETMKALRQEGLTFSLDDFGTGYSSLSYLKQMPLDQLKIDQSFVRDILIDPNDAAIAWTILALGNSLGLAVVAEGVENQGQWTSLLEQGCALFQGYFFGRPQAIDKLRLGVLAPKPA